MSENPDKIGWPDWTGPNWTAKAAIAGAAIGSAAIAAALLYASRRKTKTAKPPSPADTVQETD